MSDAELAVRLELELLSEATRADRTRLEQLLHPDFVEVGASGRRWTRAEIVAALLASPTVDGLDVSDVEAHALAADVVLVTSTTRRRDAAAVHRSSIWVRHGDGWAVRHHQGTPVPRPGPP